MTEKDTKELDEFKKEIQNYHPLKKIPLLTTYFIETQICKYIPKTIQNNSEKISNFLSKSTTTFFTFAFPLIYIYQKDRDLASDSPLFYEDK